MNQKYQVFISSTYKDLIEQRNRVVETVLRMGHLPVGMEIFNSAAKTPWDVIKSHIDNSDYYVVILAHRYGSEAPDGIGYTEKEYDYAVSRGIPCLGFVLKSGVQWNPEYTESKPAIKRKLEAFKRKIEANHVTYWTNPDELASQVLLGLTDTIRDTPGIGWVRATEAASPEVAEQLARLSRENLELTEKLAFLSSVQQKEEFSEIKEAMKTTYKIKVRNEEKAVALGKVFSGVCQAQISPNTAHVYHRATGGPVNDANSSSITDALSELLLLGLVENKDMRGYGAWVLTAKGADFYTKTRGQYD